MKSALIFLTLAASLAGQTKLAQKYGRIDVEIDGKPFTTFYYGSGTMKPYLHPLLTASGKTITRTWPIAEGGKHTSDHPHHTGLWFTHGDVNGLDFWSNLTPGPKRGQVVLDTAIKAEGNRIVADFNWLDPEGKPLLKEHRQMTFSGDLKSRAIDFDLTLTAVAPVKFGDTKEGTFAIRLADELAEKGGSGTMTSAEGGAKMKAVWGKPSPWVDYAGSLEGEPVGIAIFDHPSNPRHPTTWHARDYGLFAANIFGQHDFANDKAKDGSLELAPGKNLHFRYRVWIHGGLTADADLKGEFGKFSATK